MGGSQSGEARKGDGYKMDPKRRNQILVDAGSGSSECPVSGSGALFNDQIDPTNMVPCFLFAEGCRVVSSVLKL